MHVLLVADGRSPITRSWIEMLSILDVQISLISTFPCEKNKKVTGQYEIVFGFSRLAGGQVDRTGAHLRLGWKRKMVAYVRPHLMAVRAWLQPVLLLNQRERLRLMVHQVKPDIVHALRIPFEGMLAAGLPRDIHLVASIWGNDLTLHAHTSPLMRCATNTTLRRVDALIADTNRDTRLAHHYGLRNEIPTLVVPGSGGLDIERLRTVTAGYSALPVDMAMDYQWVVNPRGFRPGSVHQDTFFKSIPLILREIPRVRFVCPGMLGQPAAHRWVESLGIQDAVTLLPFIEQNELWRIFSHAQIYLSLSSHDGTPNSFLEAIACGCFPVVGDNTALREWVEPGQNGALVDPKNPQQAAHAVIQALQDGQSILKARPINQKIIQERADMRKVSAKVLALYCQLVV